MTIAHGIKLPPDELFLFVIVDFMKAHLSFKILKNVSAKEKSDKRLQETAQQLRQPQSVM